MSKSNKPAKAVDTALHEDRRRWPRRTVLWPAELQAGAVMHPCWVRNITAMGAALQTDIALPRRLMVTLHIPDHGRFEAFIIWADDHLHGIAFVDTPERIIERFGKEAKILGMV
jgi:hypothetical protein